MVKVTSIYLLSRVVDVNGNPVDYKDVYKILWKLQDQTRMLKNKTIQLCWEYNNFSSDYYKKNGVYPKDKEILNYTLDGFINDRLKSESDLQSGNVTTTLRDASGAFKNNKVEYLKGNKSIMEYKNNQPLDLHNKSISLKYFKNKFFFTLSLLNKNAKKEYNINRFEFECVCKDNSTKTILERCYDNIYEISASKLIYDKKKKMWKINLCYKFENQKVDGLDENKILGVDLGVVKPLMASVYGDYNRLSIDGEELIKFRQRVEQRRISLLKQTKFSGDGKIGHGRKTRCKPVDTLSDKVNNFRKSANNKYSRVLIDFAVKNNCGIIQMEDLKGITADSDRFLKNWSYFELQNMIANKATEKGIKVIKVDPKFTSQRCSKCGYIDKENRKTQATFKCIHCGYTANADYNASQNLAIKDIDKIISASLK